MKIENVDLRKRRWGFVKSIFPFLRGEYFTIALPLASEEGDYDRSPKVRLRLGSYDDSILLDVGGSTYQIPADLIAKLSLITKYDESQKTREFK